jgi:hypothetical protein
MFFLTFFIDFDVKFIATMATLTMEDDGYGLFVTALLLVLVQLSAAHYWSRQRSPLLFDQCLIWNDIVEKHSQRDAFRRHLRMSEASFHKLLDLI